VGAINDITERCEAAAKLAASEKRWRAILDALYGFIGVFNLDGTMIDVNRAPLEATGLKADDLLGKPFWETYPWSHSPFEQIRLRDMMARASQGELVRYEASVLVRGGRQTAQTAPSLLIAGGAEEPFGYVVQFAITLPSGRGKVIHHQQRVLGIECQPL
jgi:PAS domain S-box-containing protein